MQSVSDLWQSIFSDVRLVAAAHSLELVRRSRLDSTHSSGFNFAFAVRRATRWRRGWPAPSTIRAGLRLDRTSLKVDLTLVPAVCKTRSLRMISCVCGGRRCKEPAL